MEAPGILNLIAGILCLVFGALVGAVGSMMAFTPFMGVFVGTLLWVFALWGIIVGVLLIVSATKYEKEHNWALVGLIFSILGLITLQGFIVGPILGIIGSALAMGHKKKK